MPYDNGIGTSEEFEALDENPDFSEESIVTNNDEEVETLEGVDFTKFVDVEYLTPDDIKRIEAEAKAKERPVDYRYIERMKSEGVTEELAVKAFIGRFYGNEARTRFFLNSDFYYGSDAPTPLDRLEKAIREDAIPECVEMLEGTKISFDYGDHF